MLREKWGRHAQWFFVVFFQIQAVWAVMFAVPFLPVVFSMVPALGWWDIAAVAVWLVAVGGESLADGQLARFRANPENRGKTCREGLWRYSRIPHAWRLARAVRDAVHRAAVRRLDRNPRDVGTGADGLGPVVPAVGGRTVLVRRYRPRSRRRSRRPRRRRGAVDATPLQVPCRLQGRFAFVYAAVTGL